MASHFVPHSTITNILPVAARTATANGSAIDISDFVGRGIVFLDSDAGTGTTPTLDVKLQESADGSTGWTDITGAAFTQVTTTLSRQKLVLDLDAVKKFIRGVSTITGTTPSFTSSLNLIAEKQYA